MAVSENTIYRVCTYLRNWFDRNTNRYVGHIVIENGALAETYGLLSGQYFRIIGSLKNDGVYEYPVTALQDESFDGAVIGMAIPAAFIELLEKIEAWETKYADVNSANMSPYSSESFGGYSRSGGGGNSDTTKDKSGTWQGAFGAELQAWRKM